MIDPTSQVVDVDFVKHQLITMQRKRAYGEVHVTFEEGAIQIVDVNVRFWPPSRKKRKENEQ